MNMFTAIRAFTSATIITHLTLTVFTFTINNILFRKYLTAEALQR